MADDKTTKQGGPNAQGDPTPTPEPAAAPETDPVAESTAAEAGDADRSAAAGGSIRAAGTQLPAADGEPVDSHQAAAEYLSDEEAERRIRAKSRRGFLWGATAALAAAAGFEWLATRRFEKKIPWPFRRVLEVNENLSRDLFSANRLAPEFPKERARMPRPNGDYGVAADIDPDWRLRLVGLADMSAAETPPPAEPNGIPNDNRGATPAPTDKKGGPPGEAPPDSGTGAAPSGDTDSSDASGADAPPAVMVTMKQLRAFPRTEFVTELKCIEGWSTIVHWAGVRLSDLLTRYPPPTKSGKPFDPAHSDDLPDYVSMETPDGRYYVGLDMASAMHPQTLLCYEMNGAPLTAEHGAPLRLAIPVKYGIKNIKNIGTIRFTDDRPKDFWAELGYDWYAGH